MKLLALETSTDACSVALLCNDAVIERYALVRQGHTQALLPMCDELLAEAGMHLSHLDGIAFSRGPGSFTGVRIAVSAAQGLAMGCALPVYPVSSLAALALGAAQQNNQNIIAAALDARMQEVYWGYYQILDAAHAHIRLLLPECVCPAHAVPLAPENSAIAGIGPGWAAYATALRARLGARLAGVDDATLPRAANIARLAIHIAPLDPALATPVYLRDRVVHGA
ncbi:MAG: tRNA (adenosine(37)-N6)-threonylcarbamoyltransferase complex dimerization subunit type 1 TsaB [Pseudomonadota bacterium]